MRRRRLLVPRVCAGGRSLRCGICHLGVRRVDAAAKGAPLGVRLLILPGSAALWPLLLRRWLRAQ